MRCPRLLFAALLALLVVFLPVGPVAGAPLATHIPWDPRISIVWPHDGQGNPTPVERSRAVNVSVWPANQVSCTEDPGLGLSMAKNNELLQSLPIRGQLILRSVAGRTFPTYEFNNIPADLLAEPTAQFRFAVGLLGSNIWVHAADPRTFLPHPVVPTSIEPRVGSIDACIQIVWPHDERGNFAPVERAPLVNVAVDLFVHGTLKSVPLEFRPGRIQLIVAEGNGRPVLTDYPAVKTGYIANRQMFPRWVFNDVPVRPGGQYHFLVAVFFGRPAFMSPYTTVWTHAPDARTFLPQPELPPPCLP